MTTPASFPTLAGLGWSVHKKPAFSTVVASHVSGREVRTPLYVDPIWNFEVTFDGLDSTAAGSYGALGASSLQTLMGFFLSCQGKYGTFTVMDPTDCKVSGQGFGTGDGVTTTFSLVRAMGGFVEPIGVAFDPSAPTIISLPGETFWAPNNVLTPSTNPVAAGAFGYTVTTGQSDPFGGATAVLMTEEAVSDVFYDQFNWTSVAGVPTVVSLYAKQSGSLRYASFYVDYLSGGSGGAQVTMDLQNGAITQVLPFGTSSGITSGVASIGDGWNRYWISLLCGPTVTALRCGVIGCNNNPTPAQYPSYVGSTSNAFFYAAPQVEVSTAGAPGAYNPTAATPYYGGPLITAAGSLIDPSGYSLTNGAVTFASAPASGAVLKWSGMFSFLCRLDDDTLDFEQFMSNLWKVDKLTFRSVRTS